MNKIFHLLRSKPLLRQAVLGLLLILSLIALFKVFPKIETVPVWQRDIQLYWATGRLHLTGGNPYSPPQVVALYHQNNLLLDVNDIAILRYPPWTIPPMSVCGLFSFSTCRLSWLLATVVILLLGSEMIWQISNGAKKSRWLAWFVSLTFAPALFALGLGQITPLVLLGLLIFYKLMQRPQPTWKSDLAAGAALALLTIKPHIVYLFLLAVLVFALQRRRWGLLIGLGGAVLFSLLITIAINPQIIHYYLNVSQNFPQTGWATPTMGVVFRMIFGVDKIWLLFIAPAAGMLWFGFYWLKNQAQWNWNAEMPLLLLVSTATAAFGWTFDMVTLVLPIVQMFAWLQQSDRSKPARIYQIIFFVLNLLVIILHTQLDESWFVWLAPALLIWYLMARRNISLRAADQ